MFYLDFIERTLKLTPKKIGKPKVNCFNRFSIDSRTVSADECFIGIKGERFDGNDYVGEANRRGAQVFIIDRSKLKLAVRQIKNGILYPVKNTVRALWKLARSYKKSIFASVFALTGSSGKTTTRELIAAILSFKYNIHTAKKNLNNYIGLPLTMLDAMPQTHLMVLEMGMNHKGEIAALSRLCEPLAGMITNIGYAHIGMLGSLEAIAEAKSEIYEGLHSRGIAFLNRDDSFFGYLKARAPVEVVEFGLDDLQVLEDLGLEGYRLEYAGRQFVYRMPGLHNLSNLAAALKVGEFFQISVDFLLEAVARFQAVSGRSQILHSPYGTLINDCYNSNPSSMIAALRLLGKSRPVGKRIAVVSDMLELGRNSKFYHRMIGKFIADNQFADLVMGYGDDTEALIEEVRSRGIEAISAKNCEQLAERVTDIAKPEDVILVKASRGMHLEKVVEALRVETH